MSSSTVTSSCSRVHYGQCELDSHADTIVAGKNCIVLSYTGKECSVVPYREGYESTDNVPIANVVMAWKCPENGEIFILIFHEALWMGYLMDDSLINPNQLLHYSVNVQDDPTPNCPLSVISENGDFSMLLHRKGTIVYFDTHTPTQKELDTCPHINLSSRHPWNTSKVDFVKSQHSLQEEIERIQHVSTVTTDIIWSTSDSCGDKSDFIFSLSNISRKIAAMGMTCETEKVEIYPYQETLQSPNEGSGQSEKKLIPTFQNTGRHTDTSTEYLSQRWHISVS